MTLTSAQLEELHRMNGQATPAPWARRHLTSVFVDGPDDVVAKLYTGENVHVDAALIVAMRNSLGALLKERERDKARIVEMGDALTKIRHAGALLANCAYNLHQQDGIGVRAKQSLKVSFEGWDAVAHLGRSSATLPDARTTGASSLGTADTTADARPDCRRTHGAFCGDGNCACPDHWPDNSSTAEHG